MKSVAQLERAYRARRRAAGEKLHIISARFTPEQNAYCHGRQISRSEYLVELIKADRPRRLQLLASAEAKR